MLNDGTIIGYQIAFQNPLSEPARCKDELDVVFLLDSRKQSHAPTIIDRSFGSTEDSTFGANRQPTSQSTSESSAPSPLDARAPGRAFVGTVLDIDSDRTALVMLKNIFN